MGLEDSFVLESKCFAIVGKHFRYFTLELNDSRLKNNTLPPRRDFAVCEFCYSRISLNDDISINEERVKLLYQTECLFANGRSYCIIISPSMLISQPRDIAVSSVLIARFFYLFE